MKKSPRFFRRALTLALAFALSFSVTTRAYALSARFQIGDCSDDVQRVETRLSDLGYLSAVVNGRWEQTDADALAAFAEANKTDASTVASVLFSSSKPFR